MDGNVSAEDISDVDWTTDDESEINESEINVGNEEASTSTSGPRTKLIGHFVAMGFPEKLVSKAIDENGEGNSDAILNSLLTFSTLEDSPPQQLSTNSDPCSSDCNDVFPNDLSDMDSWSEDEIEDFLKVDSGYKSEKHKMLLAMEKAGSLSEKEQKILALANMGYALEEASIAVNRSPEASVAELTDLICAAQAAREEDRYLPEDDLKVNSAENGTWCGWEGTSLPL